MSEVLAQLEKKGGGGTLNVTSYGVYTNNTSITCNKGDIVVFTGNFRDTSSFTNLTPLTQESYDVGAGGAYPRVWTFMATEDNFSANCSMHSGKVYYVVISATN